MATKTDKGLTPKQEQFCLEYLIDLNATQAAIRAGYPAKTADKVGSQLLGNTRVSQRVSELMNKRSERTQLNGDMVIAELAKIGFHNIKDFVNGGNSILEIKHIEDEKTAAISGIKTIVKEDGSVHTELKMHDKKGALELLGRHFGIFEKDNSQKAPPININNLGIDDLNKLVEMQKKVAP